MNECGLEVWWYSQFIGHIRSVVRRPKVNCGSQKNSRDEDQLVWKPLAPLHAVFGKDERLKQAYLAKL